jgi:endonuclease YncB( thermonuclease family)
MVSFGPYPAVVRDWHDGDTCHIDVDLGFGIHATGFSCRVYGINAPELSTPEGKPSKLMAETICPPMTKVEVVSYGWDKYSGRFDGAIRLPDGRDFGAEMVDAGQAVWKAYS